MSLPSEAGGSASAEHDRWLTSFMTRWRATLPKRLMILASFSVAAGLLAALALAPFGLSRLGVWVGIFSALSLLNFIFDVPNHVDAWRKGAMGEQKTAKHLAKLPAEFIVLHDRRVPGSKANIDHLVIGPTGVIMIDTKNYKGKITENRAGELWSGRYPMTRKIKTAKWEADEASKALATPVVAMLCVHGAELPRRNLVKNGVRIVGPRGMLRFLKKSPPILSPNEVGKQSKLALSALPSATTSTSRETPL